MRRMRWFLFCCAAFLAGTPGAVGAQARADTDCHAGAYAFTDGSVVDVVPSGDQGQLRWHLLDGRTGRLTAGEGGTWTSTLGWTSRADGIRVAFGDCADGRMEFDGHAARRLRFDVREVDFAGDGGTRLHGRLLLPAGANRIPVVVWVQGSGPESALRTEYLQYRLPAHGIGVFVYDKRGTGRSEGHYTQDFHRLAADAAVAARQARRLAGDRLGRIGFHGVSQGGWIAPLAALAEPVDFVAVGYGLAESPLAEDRGQVVQDLVAAGFDDPRVLRRAREVTDATGAVIASRYTAGFAALASVRARYAGEPWWSAVRGEFTGELIKHDEATLRAQGPAYDTGTPWTYEPMPTLRRLRIPLLWVVAGDDTEAPPTETRRRIRALVRSGRPVTLVEFPGAEHDMLDFETRTDGRRIGTRVTPGYQALLIDWIRTGRLRDGDYGRGILVR